MNEYEAIISKAASEYSPALIANYTFELAKTFNVFYTNHSVMNEENFAIKAMRFALIEKVANTIKHAMGLMGIEVPEKM